MGHRDLGSVADHRRMQPRSEILGHERRIARRGQQEPGVRRLQCARHPRQRTGEAADGVGDDAASGGGAVRCGVAVRVHDDLRALRAERVDGVRDHRTAGDRDEALVLAAHAPRPAAREDDGGDVPLRIGRHGARCPGARASRPKRFAGPRPPLGARASRPQVGRRPTGVLKRARCPRSQGGRPRSRSCPVGLRRSLASTVSIRIPPFRSTKW